MRNHGPRFGLVRMGPHDHIGWIFSGPGEFAALAEPFLAEGGARNERLMYVADDPDTAVFGPWTDSLPPGTLTGATVAEVYGESGIVDAAKQQATFAQVLDQALAAGYSGIRVAADNTPLVLGPERIDAWMRWEIVADHFMSQNPVTGLCAFDKTRTDVNTLSHLATFHPVWPAESDQPPFRLFSNDSALWLEGEVNSFTLGQARLALENLPAKTTVVVDLTNTEIVTNDALSALRQLCETGVGVTVRGATEIVRKLAQSTGIAPQSLSWGEAQGA
jgi:MEDS: MEthanogen/methylotroph, DcmR Sensory domain